MNKEKMTLAVIGGVFALLLAAAGYFVYDAYATKCAIIEGAEDGSSEGLEAVSATASQLSRKPVYPCRESVRAIRTNETALADWRDDALKLASRGDRMFDKKLSAPAFKTMIVADAKRLGQLPGGVNGHILKPEFTFGPFKDIIIGDKMPADAQLMELQRQWDDIAMMIEVLSKCGVVEVTAVDFKPPEVKVEEKPAKGKSAKKPRPAAKKGQKAKAQGPHGVSYVLSFNAKQDAFVRVVNAFATCERFVVVNDFGFTRPRDVIVEALGGEVKKTAQEAAATQGRRRRRGAAAAPAVAKKNQAEGADKEKKIGAVTDPLIDAPLAVTVKLTIVDFGSLEEGDEEKGEAKAKGDAKSKTKEAKK